MARRRGLIPGKYTAIGFVASKLVLPLLRRRMKKQAKSAAVGAARAGAGAVTQHPLRASVAVGSAIGAVGYLVMKRTSTSAEDAARAAASKASSVVPPSLRRK